MSTGASVNKLPGFQVLNIWEHNAVKPLHLAILLCLITASLASACSDAAPSQVPHLEVTSQPVPTTVYDSPTSSLSPDAVATLLSLRQVDDYPLYTMQYMGEYTYSLLEPRPVAQTSGEKFSSGAWGCSLFAALGTGSDRLYGRNFDWEFSPALLLFTAPPDGYASVSMVDIAYLGFAGDQSLDLAELSPEELQGLLEAPAWPFDGMNSQGLAIGMAAVPDGQMAPDPDRPTLDSLMIMREVLDHAANVSQALEIFARYNVDMGGGPPLHYLLADVTGAAALVEYYQGEMHIFLNATPYHLATNFLISATGDATAGQCPRYDAISETLIADQGALSTSQAFQLLSMVAQESTQWSVVYDLSNLAVGVVPGQNYEQVHWFDLK
jgi:hypothetical protein